MERIGSIWTMIVRYLLAGDVGWSDCLGVQ